MEATAAKTNAALAHGGVLVHEFGHWMGLPHTFGNSDCGVGDKITDTLMFPKNWDCFQSECFTDELFREKNWMSVSFSALFFQILLVFSR